MLTMLGSGAWPGVGITPAVTAAATAISLSKLWRALCVMHPMEICIIFWLLALALLIYVICGCAGRAFIHCSSHCHLMPCTGCFLIPAMLTTSLAPLLLMFGSWLLAVAAFVVASLGRI